MRILVISPRSITCSRAGGAEIYIHEILTRIALKGCRIFVISSSDKKVHHRHLSYTEYLVSRHEILFPISSVRYAKLIRYVDVVIENISKFPIIWPLLLSKALSKPFIAIVYHIHGKTLFKELPFPIALMFYIYEIFSLKLYSLLGVFIVTISESTRKELIILGFSPHQIILVEVGLDPKLKIFNTTKNERPLIVYVGRVKKYKRLDHLIKALKIVVQEVPYVECIIAGKGDEKVYRELENLTKNLGLEKHVKFEGEVDTERKIELLTKAWVYVMPSMKEGFGISALEAQACGTPVVGYKVPGLIDCVKNNVTGLLASDGDFKALADAIKRLLLEKELILKMANNAIKYAKSFSWENSADKFYNFLMKILK